MQQTKYYKMKKYILLIILVTGLPSVIKAQDSIPSLNKRITGRWIESKRINGNLVKEITSNPDTYIFRDNLTFHKGEVAEGVILFNVAGRYTATGDSIVIHYQDFTQKGTNRKVKKLVLKVLSLSEKEMEVVVKDYDYEYQMVLTK